MHDPDELDAALASVAAELSGAALESLVRNAVQPMADKAVELAPVRSGKLVAAIGVNSRHSARTATASIEVAGSGPGGTVREAIFTEYGTSRMAAEPFMRPAFEMTQGEVQARIATDLASRLKPHT